MMTDLFLQWNEENHKALNNMGVTIDQILMSKEPTNNVCVAIDYLSKACLGRVSVWESGNIDIEILDIDSEKVLLYEHYDFDKSPDFWNLLKDYFNIMQHGS